MYSDFAWWNSVRSRRDCRRGACSPLTMPYGATYSCWELCPVCSQIRKPQSSCTEGLFPLRKSKDLEKVMLVLWEVINAPLFYTQSPACGLHGSCPPHFLHLMHVGCALSAPCLLRELPVPSTSMDVSVWEFPAFLGEG